MRIVVVGAGGHGQAVADALGACRRAGRPVEVTGFVDDGGHTMTGGSVLGSVADLPRIPHDAVVVAIGDNVTRNRICERLRSAGERLVAVIDPRAMVAGAVEIGDGAMLCLGAVVATGATVGRAVILNTASSIDHHCRIGNYAHIGPGARLGGEVVVGIRAFVGIGATILPRVTIGHDAIVGAGAVVTRDVAPHVTVVGVPAAPLAHRGPRVRLAQGSAR